VVLSIGHALRAHEALGRPDALAGFPEVVHRLFENCVFVGHDRSIRIGASSDYPIVSPSMRVRRQSATEVERADEGKLDRSSKR
jgi:hypothetical protein